MKPYKGRRLSAAERTHRLETLAEAVGPATGRLMSLVAGLAPGPAGMALRGILGAYDAMEERKREEENRELQAEVRALRKAVTALEGLAELATPSTDQPAPG